MLRMTRHEQRIFNRIVAGIDTGTITIGASSITQTTSGLTAWPTDLTALVHAGEGNQLVGHVQGAQYDHSVLAIASTTSISATRGGNTGSDVHVMGYQRIRFNPACVKRVQSGTMTTGTTVSTTVKEFDPNNCLLLKTGFWLSSAIGECGRIYATDRVTLTMTCYATVGVVNGYCLVEFR